MAYARTPDGPLGALNLPNNARPAVAYAGETFAVAAHRRGELRIVNESAQFTLAPDWADTPMGAQASVSVPGDAPAGTYSVEWSQGDEGDQNARALYVLPTPEPRDSFSHQYAVACVSIALEDDTTAGATDLSNEINGSRAQFAAVFVTGPEERYGDVLNAVDTWTVPTIVVADAPESVCRRWFGPRTFLFRYGPDAFIAPACGADGLGDGLGPVTERLATLRQDCKTARWTIGLFSRAETSIDMRNEITLFVDSAFHACIYGPARDTTKALQPHAWAGWFEPPRQFALSPGRVAVFAANRKGIAIQKPEPKSP